MIKLPLDTGAALPTGNYLQRGMNMILLFQISSALIVGMLMTRVVKPLKLPAVTAYLVAGILIGPYFLGGLGIEGLGFSSIDSVKALSLISNVALGFIAFDIGNEFRLSSLRQTGKAATVIAFTQALTATLFVDITLAIVAVFLGDKFPLPAAITLGAIATATAPAATLMVVRQYRAKGKLTDILLPIVALDDAIGLVVFAVSFGIAKALVNGQISVLHIILEPIIEVTVSLVLGAIMGAILTVCQRWFKSMAHRLIIVITFVFITTAMSMEKFEIGGIKIAFSSLLVCMMLGTIFCNLCEDSEEIMERTEGWTETLYVVFFVLSGAELELNVFADLAIVGVGVLYILSRSAGKYIGSFYGAAWMKCDRSIRDYLGITLLPQAGVALGMSVQAEALPGCGSLVRNITLFAILIYELIGPMLTKTVLIKAGDISPDTLQKVKHH